MTRVRTARATYIVTDVSLDNGRITVHARSESGKSRKLTRKDVHSARWYAALDHYFGQRRGLTA